MVVTATTKEVPLLKMETGLFTLGEMQREFEHSGPIHTGRDAKEMEPIDVNGSVHTARKQHQRKNVPICVRVASRVLCGLGLKRLSCCRSVPQLLQQKERLFKARFRAILVLLFRPRDVLK